MLCCKVNASLSWFCCRHNLNLTLPCLKVFGGKYHTIIFVFNRWAVSTVMTRQNIIPASAAVTQSGAEAKGEGQGTATTSSSGVLALIPLWDMCNHNQGEVRLYLNNVKITPAIPNRAC